MVPIEEMTDLLKVVKCQPELKQKQWVRLRRGLYKNDLAQVNYVNLSEKEVNLKLVPRIDYNKFRESASSSDTVSLFHVYLYIWSYMISCFMSLGCFNSKTV